MGNFARLIVLLVCACTPLVVEPPAPRPPPGPDDDEIEWCPAACDKMVMLGCADATVCTKYAEPSDECIASQSCADWCKTVVIDAPSGVVFHPKCLALTEPLSSVSDTCSWLDEACGAVE